MHLLRLSSFVLLLASTFFLAGCGEEEPQQDPCRGVVCPQGFDCVAGECREREVPEPPAGCEVNADCFQNPAGPFCQRTSGSCVACLADDHCGERRCSGGACVGEVCGVDADCPAETPFCNEAGDACVACRDADDCGAGEACEAGACVDAPVECTSDEECAEETPERPFCDESGERGLCVACRDDIDCADGLDCRGGACVDLGCASDDDCAPFPGLPVCGEEGRCVGCEVDDHCAAGEICEAGTCVDPATCSRDEDCEGDPDGPFCDVASGACVPCLGDADCPLGQRCAERAACEPIGCTGTGDCPIGASCEDGSCVDPGPCAGEADCTFDPRAPWCNDEGRCVRCTADAHCGAGERCVGEICVVPQECTSDAQCPGGGVCAGGVCATCRTAAECPRGTCRLGACVDEASCTSDLDCARGVCAGGVCASCATALDCSPGLWCESGACVPPPSCVEDADCGPGRSCDGGACTAFACEGQEEPNDAPADATPFAAGAPVSGRLCANDVDWWVFTAPQGAGLNANLIGAPAGTALDLHWYDPATGELLRQRGIAGKLRTRALPAAAQARYYLQVRGTGGGSYGLLATTAAGGLGCGDLLEPNDARNAPRAVQVGWLEGLDLCGDDDFYLVDVPAGRPLHAAIFAAPGDPALALEIFTGGGESRIAAGTAHGWLGGGLHAFAGPQPPARQLLVKVSRPGASDLPYDLFLSTDGDAPSCATAPELFDGADRIRLDASTMGFGADQPAGACGGGGPDRAWRVHLDEARRLAVEVRAPFAARLALLDGDCTSTIACAATLASGIGVLDVPHLPAGDYTLSVGGVPDAAGPLELAARLHAPLTAPAADACGAVHLPLTDGQGAASGSTAGAISDADLSCAPGAPDVFHTFTVPDPAPAPGPVRVVIDLASSGPASLALLDPACSAAQACEGPASTSRIDTTLSPGQWTVGIAASSGAPVSYDLEITLPPTIPNDTCAGATPLAVGGGISGDTTWAADDLSLGAPSSSCTGYFTSGNDVFYALDLTAGETIEVTLHPAPGYDAAIYLLDGCGGSCVAGADLALEEGMERLVYTATATGIHYLVVDGGAGGGGYTLQVDPGVD